MFFNAPPRHSKPFRLLWRLGVPELIQPASPRPPGSASGRSGHFGTLLGANGGTQTHSRRTGWKLGRLSRARQGLVRVPESNTKYGGKPGKTGGEQRPLSVQLSVSPELFPSRKSLTQATLSGSARCSQGNYLLSARACSGETQLTLREEGTPAYFAWGCFRYFCGPARRPQGGGAGMLPAR